jgi:sugar (pentulose or hexulose) kinase
LRPTAGDILRAFLESIAYAVRANVAQIEHVTGVPTARLIAGGGLSRSDLLMHLTSDIVGLPVRRACEAESTGLGCAILVASGAGVYGDAATAVRSMCRHSEIAPDPELRAQSENGFAKWRELYDSLGNLSL